MNITHISQFDEILKNKLIRCKKETVEGEEVSIISYMIDDGTLFHNELERERRGITFNSFELFSG